MKTLINHLDDYINSPFNVRAETTKKVHKKVLKAFINRNHLNLVNDLSLDICALFINDKEKAINTRHTRLGILRGFFEHLIRVEVLDENFLSLIRMNIKLPKPPRPNPRPFSKTETSATIAAAKALDAHSNYKRNGHSYELMTLLMVQEGLRSIEVRRLEAHHIDMDNRIMEIKGKGGRDRLLPISDQTFKVLNKHFKATGNRNGFVLKRINTWDQLSANAVYERMAKVIETGGIKTQAYDGRTAHGLRRTAASDVYKKSQNDVVAVQQMLGHENLKSTQHYIGLNNPEELRKKMNGRNY